MDESPTEPSACVDATSGAGGVPDPHDPFREPTDEVLRGRRLADRVDSASACLWPVVLVHGDAPLVGFRADCTIGYVLSMVIPN